MAILDPRGRLTLDRFPLALRPGSTALGEGAILFYDNVKMDVGHYRLLIPRIKDRLRERGITRFVAHRETIRGKTVADIAALASRFSDMKVAAAVIALADMGVSPAMVALTVEMEKAGIPTVCLTAEPGSSLAAAHAHYRAGSLCLIDLDINPSSPAEVIVAQADACISRIATMLTATGAELERATAIDYPLDRESAAADGYLPGLTSHQANDEHAVYEYFESLHIGDGLPFIAPTSDRYERMREYCPFDPDEVIVSGVGPSGTPITVKDILVSAVMAGCRPQFVPIVLTAVRAISRPPYGLLQAVTTSFSGGHFVLASGPIAREAGLHGGQGCLGPGFRANATIGRAVNLVLLNVCRSVPGFADLACMSSPAEYTYCIGEDPTLSAWPAMNAERFDADTTCVMTLKAEAPHNVLDIVSTTAAGLMETIVDCCTSLGSNNAFVAGPLVLVLTPDHADLLARDGYDKHKLRREIHASAHISLDKLSSRGLVGAPAQGMVSGFHHVTRSQQDVEIVVAGGKGGHSVVILPWALHSEAVYEAVRLQNGAAAKHLDEFRVALEDR